MSTDAVMSTSQDAAEEQRDGPEMMAIEKKDSNVSMVNATASLTVNAATLSEPESRDDKGDTGGRTEAPSARSDSTDEHQGAAAAAKKIKKVPPKKRNPVKGRVPVRQPPQTGHFPPQQRGPMAPYHSQMMVGGGGHPHAYGAHPSYGYGAATGAPTHDMYRGRPQYTMPPMPHHQNQQAYAPAPGSYHPGFATNPYGAPPPHMYAAYQGAGFRPPMSSFTSGSDDTASLGSSKSKGSKSGGSNNSMKKRTIDGVAPPGVPLPQGLSSAFTMHRTHSNSSTSSTVTAGNNTSTDTPNLTEDSPQKMRNHLPPLSSRPDFQHGGGPVNMMYDDSHKQGYHRRDFSGASTTSSLSVGGLSLSSYETRGSKDDAPMMRNSPKRRRHEEASANVTKLTVKTEDNDRRENLFLSLSTSPINSDVEATPVSKNSRKMPTTTTMDSKPSSVQELKQAPSMESIQTSDTPTPPVPIGSAGTDIMTDDHLLNRHLRGQTFTPLPHIGHYSESREGHASPPGISANPSFGSAIGAQLSWDITGDAPSLGDIAEWEEPPKDARPGSVASQASCGAIAQWKEGEMVPSSHYPASGGGEGRNYDSVMRLSVLSPHSDEEMEDTPGASAPGGTTPIPFYDSHERENGHLKLSASFSKDGSGTKPPSTLSMSQTKYGDAEHIHQMFVTNGGRGSSAPNSQQRTPMNWTGSANYMRFPPAPLYTSSEKSPMSADRVFFPNANTMLNLGGANDRIRNLRGRAPPGGPRMPMTHQLSSPYMTSYSNHNLTSPIGSAPAAKGATWSPHGAPSPNRVMQPDQNSNSKRKCLPMKPPIPTKFQGDMEKFKHAHVPEFSNLVNFPTHMSQSTKQGSSQLPDGMKCCVMCGNACPCSTGGKHKKNRAKPMDSLAARNVNAHSKEQQMAIIPAQNKGLCTLCDVNVWIVSSNGLEIKWCKGCKNFRPWASFGDKGLATKCLRCRDRQREKYAIQKEEKERLRLIRKAAKQAAKAH